MTMKRQKTKSKEMKSLLRNVVDVLAKKEETLTINALIDYKSGDIYGLDKKYLKEFAEKIGQSAVVVTIKRRK